MNLTGVFGAVVAVFPGLYRRFAGLFLYDRPDSVEWTERLTTGVRLVGVLYVSWASRRTGSAAATPEAASPTNTILGLAGRIAGFSAVIGSDRPSR